MKTLIVAVAFQGLLALVSSHVIRDEPLKVILPEDEIPLQFFNKLSSSPQNIIRPGQETIQQVDLCNCGRSAASKIVGGTDASEGEFPWRVKLFTVRDERAHICGATIISPRWLLTAAHCFKPDNWVYAKEAGKINPVATLTVKSVVTHQNYTKIEIGSINDIALVELEEDLDFSNPNIAPACLPYRLAGQTERTGKVVASGWGDLRENDTSKSVENLQKVTLDMIGNRKCEEMAAIEPDARIFSTQVCTYTDYKDTCKGDSGGSIDELIDGKSYAVGVVSYGNGCARRNEAAVYTRVSEFTSWIEQETKIQNFCKT